MSKQKNFRLKEDTVEMLDGLSIRFNCSSAKIVEQALWLMVDVLDYGDEFENKISLIKKSVEYALKH